MNSDTIINALTIDVEDWFQIHAFSDNIRQEDWESFEPRVERNTYRILDILDSTELFNPQLATRNSVKATFFVLGWIAERYPNLVREIHKRGHEVACHGYAHQVIFNQSKEEFREDVAKAKRILEELTGEEVIGYRAPTYSITRDTLWALEILHELGFKYDSSIFPIRHDVYGFPGASRFPCLIILSGNNNSDFKMVNSKKRNGDYAITEFPMATVRVFGKNFPIAGGGYFRLFPYPVTKTFLKRINRREQKPFVFYLHPWEIDPDLPRMTNVSLLSRFRTYVNLDKTKTRFKRLLSDFSFGPLSDLFLEI